MTDNELLWKMYEDNRHQAQLHEDRRINAATIIAGGAGALITAAMSNGLSADDIPVALMVIVIGVFGWLIAVKATERMRMHNTRCSAFLKKLDEIDQTHDLVGLKKSVDDKHKKQYWFSSGIPLSLLWQWLNLLIAFAGVVLLLMASPTTGEAVQTTWSNFIAWIGGLIH